jgi:thiol-disulfide isomerase/thioredoxin
VEYRCGVVGVIVAAVALVAATAVGVIWRRRNGVLRPQHEEGHEVGAQHAGAQDTAGRLSAEDLGAPLGVRATLVQFSTAFCAPCRATRQILAEVGEMVDGVHFTEIDAESHLDLVRRLGVIRTPTVLVLDADGRIMRRGSGRPRKADIIGALGAVVHDAAQNPSASGVSPD